MKKKILLSVFVLLSVITFAQSKIRFGAATGINIYSMRGETVTELNQFLNFANGIITTQPVTGFHAGGYAIIPLGENLSLEPGLYYSSKGYEAKGTYTVKDISILSAAATAALNTNYIDMPLVLKANFNGLQLFAGPQVSYLTGADLHTKVSVAVFNVLNSNTDITNRFNRWDAAVTGGIGYQFENGIRLTASYERGLTKLDAEKNTHIYNQGFRVGAGFTF